MIKIYDNFLNDRELQLVSNTFVSRSWFFIDDYKDNYKRFHTSRTLGVAKNKKEDLDEFDFFFINKIKEKLNINLNENGIRILMNCFKYGDTPTTHTDNSNNCLTFLFFTNPEWKWWHGSGGMEVE